MRFAEAYAENDVLAVYAKYHLRPNYNHCIIYPFDVEEYGTWRRISSIEGVALSLLNGERRSKDVAAMLSYLFDIGMGQSENVMRTMIAHSRSEPGKEFLELCKPDGWISNSCNVEKFINGFKCDDFDVKKNENKLDVPLSLLLMPSNKCDVNCIYCYSERRQISHKDHLPVGRWLEIIDEAADNGIDIVTLSGGDPFTYAGIDELFKKMASRKIKFLAPTKTYISKERAGILLDTGMCETSTIQISIDGCGPVVDKMMGVRDYAPRAIESIENLTEKGFFVRTNTVCTPMNLREIPNLVRMLYKKGVKRAGITNYARSFFRHNEALFLSQVEIEWAKEQINKLKDELTWDQLRCNMGIRDFSCMDIEEKKIGWRKRAHCSGGKSSMSVTADGRVILCEQVPQEAPYIVGDLKNNSLREVWNSIDLQAFVCPPKELFSGTVCSDCDVFNECHSIYGRCFRDALFTYGSPYSPSPNCPRAPKGIRMS